MARVLLVDDDIAEISAVKRVLSRAGHQPLLVTNAQDAVASIGRSPPDLLLVGATCEGGAALRRFAGEPAVRSLPIIVLGEGSPTPPGSTQVPRPVDPSQLADRIAASLAAGPPAPAGIAPPGGMPAPRRVVAAGKVGPATRSGPRTNGAPASDAAARRAAADALRARAEELRRGASAPAPAPAPAARARPATPPATRPPLAEDGGLEAILRRAEEAERAHAAERKARARQADRATVEAAQRAEAERLAVEKAARARAAEERARKEERARHEAEERARAEAEERERAEERTRRKLESELDELRDQVESERRAADEKTRAALARAKAEERAAEEVRRLAEEEAREEEQEQARRRDVEEEKLRQAIESARSEMESFRRRSEDEARAREVEEEALRKAIASAHTEMESLRRRSEDEARRRAEAEAEVARLARVAERRAAEEAAQPPPLDFPLYRPPREEPVPDPAEEAARRRVASLRDRPARAPRADLADPPATPAEADPEAPRSIPPAPPELRSGSLADVPVPRLLALAARAELSGRIDLESETARSIWFEEGRVVGAASANPLERVEEIALRLGLVTRDQHRQISGQSASLASRRAAVLLVERGFLKPIELTPLVRRRTEEVVFGAFADAEARFRWEPSEVPPDERTALERGTLALAVEGVRRRWLAPQVDAVLGGAGSLLAPVGTAPSATDLGLSPPERRAVALADGLRTLDEIVAASPLDPLSTRQVLAALVLVGALALRVFQGGRPAAAATAAIDLARVREKLDQVRRADYFTILGVGRLCTPHEVREAAARLEAEFDPRRFEGGREEGLEARLEEILGVVADAREILVDDRLRAEYLRGLGD